MKKRINYGDNLFLLTLILKDLSSAARLNLDPDFFLDKLVEDIFFLDASVSRFLDLLLENTHLIDRTEHLKSLRRISQSLASFLADLRDGRLPLGEYLKSFEEKFIYLEEAHRKITRRVDDLLLAAEARRPEQEHTVSEQELQFLLAEEAWGEEGKESGP